MFSDTSADFSVVSVQQAVELHLPLAKTRMRIKPCSAKKRTRCIGIYVVNGDVQPLLSRLAADDLGMISFHGDRNIHRAEVDDPINQVSGIYVPICYLRDGENERSCSQISC